MARELVVELERPLLLPSVANPSLQSTLALGSLVFKKVVIIAAVDLVVRADFAFVALIVLGFFGVLL